MSSDDFSSVVIAFAAESHSLVRRPAIPGPQPNKNRQKNQPVNYSCNGMHDVMGVFGPADGGTLKRQVPWYIELDRQWVL